MTLKDCRQQFLSAGYSKSEYAETVASFGKEAEVWVAEDCIIVQQTGYARFIRHPFKGPAPDTIVDALGHAPPINAEFLFYIFLDARNCDAIVGDLEERYKLIANKFGQRKANFWYWTQTVRSLGPLAWAALKGGVKKLSGLTALFELWRRIRG